MCIVACAKIWAQTSFISYFQELAKPNPKFVQISHVSLFNSENIERLYSLPDPVIDPTQTHLNFTTNSLSQPNTSAKPNSSKPYHFTLLIKLYAQPKNLGKFTSKFEENLLQNSLKSTLPKMTHVIDFTENNPTVLSVSSSIPNLKLILFGAGTGVAPFLNLLNSENLEKIYYFRSKSKNLAGQENQPVQNHKQILQNRDIISAQNSEKLIEFTSRLQPAQLMEILAKYGNPPWNDYTILTCGPPMFNNLIIKVLRNHGKHVTSI